jgi:hypothetical protein
MVLLPPIYGRCFIVEQGLPGAPMGIVRLDSGGRRIAESAGLAFSSWLAQFQSCTTSGHITVTRPMLHSMLQPVLEELGVDRTGATSVYQVVEPLAGSLLPLVWSYGDAHPTNLLLRDGEISGVVDWEGMQPDRWPTRDWFQFLMSMVQEHLKVHAPRMDAEQRVLAAIDLLLEEPVTPLGRICHRWTQHFFASTDIDPELARPLFLVFLFDYFPRVSRESVIQCAVAHCHSISANEDTV